MGKFRNFKALFRNSLGKRLFIISLLSIFTVVGVAEVFAFPKYVDNLVQTKRDSLQMSVRQSRDQLDYFLGAFIDISTKLNKDLRLRETLNNIVEKDKNGQISLRNLAVNEAQQLVQNEFDTLNQVWGIRLFRWTNQANYEGSYQGLQSRILQDPTLLITDNDSSEVIVDTAAEQFLQRVVDADGSVVWDTAVTGGRFKDLLTMEDHQQSYLLGKLLVNRVDPTAQYILTLEFDPQSFEDFLAEFNQAGDQQARLVDTREQIIIYDQDPKLIGQKVNSVQPSPPPWMQKMGKPGQRGLAQDQKKSEARGGFMPVGPERFPKEMLVYAPLTVAPWQVMTTIDFRAINDAAWLSLWQLNVGLIGAALIISFLIAWYTKRSVARPIVRLGRILNAVGETDVVPETVAVRGTDELAGLGEATNRVAELVIKVNAITSQIRQLLDYSGQGFLSFGHGLTIEPTYSQACEWMLGMKHLGGKSVASLLFEHEELTMQEMLVSVFGATTSAEREMYISLFPQEFKRNGRTFEISYKTIMRGHELALMLVLTDVTMQRRLMEKIESESKMLQMIVKVVQQKSDFFYTIDEWKRFVAQDCSELIHSQNDDWMDVFDQLYRAIHTFKGSFGQFGLSKAAKQLHELETSLSEAAEAWEEIGHLQEHVATWSLDKVLELELEMLQDVLGETFFHRNTGTVIDMARLHAFEKRIVDVLAEREVELVRAELRRLNHVSIRQLFEAYPRFVSELAEGLEKFVHPLLILGDDVLVDPDRYRSWTQSFVHLFRNMLDHGIETPDERLESGKDEFGTIRCDVRAVGENMVLTVSDDGRGINTERVKQKAIEKQLITPEDAALLEVADVIGFIFADSFSTKDTVSELSGRGVGMSAVKAETEALGGTLTVKSKLGEGTIFMFEMPIE